MRPALIALSLATSLFAVAAPALADAPVAAAAAPVADTYPQGRLPDAVSPQAYRIDLTVDPAQPRFSGTGEIDSVIKAPTSRIFLHGRDLTVSKAEARVGGKVFKGTWRQRDSFGVAELTFAEPLPAGPVTFAFAWDAELGDGPAGLYRIKVGDAWHVWSQLQSIDARAVFPSFDEPGFKVPFTVTLRTPPGLLALSNAPRTGSTLENGLEVHRFAPTLPLPTYLVAFVVGPFKALEGAVPPTPQRARPLPLRIVTTQPNADKMAFALKGSEEIVALLETYFGDGFPYPKLDQITSPVMPGAMENAGADIYGDAILIMDEDAPVSDKRQFGMVVAHELAHQWFGDLVTPAWWDDIWLNESFANWMGYRIGQEWRPDLNIGAGAVAEGFAAMDTDELIVGRPIRQPIESNAQVDGAFDTITYGKGGHVVAMIAAFMGDERFRDGVRRYMAAHRNGNATTADFFAAMAEAAGNPRILPAMQGFVHQQGVPLLTVAGKPGNYRLGQSRYAPLGATMPATRWGIPACLRLGTARQCTLLEGSEARLSLTGKGALMPNAGGTGYYRFELPASDWNRLIAQSDRLTGGEALALADSLEASFRAGRATLPQLASLARRMVRNPDSYASAAATGPLRRLASEGVIAPAASARVRAWLAGLNAPLLAEYGFNPALGAYAREDADRRQRRAQIVAQLAGKGRDEKLTLTLRDAARAWLAGETAALDPEWYGVAFDALLAETGQAGARDLLDRALASEDPAFRPVAIAAAAGTGDLATARWLLEEFKDTRLRANERIAMVGQVMRAPETRDYGYGWVKENLGSLIGGSSGIFMATRMPRLLEGYCSVERAGEIERDFTPLLKGTRAELALARTVEKVRNCGRLKDARGAEATAAALRLR